MKKQLLSLLTTILLLSLVACSPAIKTVEALTADVTLSNGMEITSLANFNKSGLEADAFTQDTWFGNADAANMDTKLSEMQALEDFYAEKYPVEGQGFTVEDSVIGWRWVEYDEYYDFSLTRAADAATYTLDINYNVPEGVDGVITEEDGKDMMCFLLSFVSSEPELLATQIYEDCFINEETLISDEGWCAVEDCEVQWNADSGVGISFVIRECAVE